MKESIDKDSAIAFAGETSESKGHISPTWTAENNVQVDSEPAVEHRLVGWRLLSVQFCLLLGLLLSAMEASIVATALITIAETFNNYITVQWVVLAYLLSYMGFSVIVVRLSDVFGRKWIVISCFVIFGTFSLACGLSQSIVQLIVFRSIQGIGGAGLYAMCMVTIVEITAPKNFAAMSGGIGMTFATASSLGPIVGGAITKAGHWRWIFLLNVPASVVAISLLLLVWRQPSEIKGKLSIRQIDYIGALLLLGSSVLVVFAFQEAGATTYAWHSSVIIGTLVVGGCCVVAFAAWIWAIGRRGEKSRIRSIVPRRIFANHVIIGVLLSTLITGYVYISTLIDLPQRFQIVNQKSSLSAGVHLLPLVLASALGSMLGGTLNSKRNNTFYTLNTAAALILLGSGLLSTLPVGTVISHAQYGYQIILGFGCGLTFSTATVMTAFYSEPEDIAATQGAVAQARMLGGSIGLAIATIVLNRNFTAELSSILTPTELSNLRQSLSTLLQLQPTQQLAVTKVFANSFNDQLRICTYIAAVGVLASLSTWTRVPARRRGQEKAAAEAVEGV